MLFIFLEVITKKLNFDIKNKLTVKFGTFLYYVRMLYTHLTRKFYSYSFIGSFLRSLNQMD